MSLEQSLKHTRLKQRIVAHLGGRCVLCGYDACLAALIPHHIDPRAKEFSISTRKTWSVVERELKKCVLLCATHHAEVHAGMHPQLLQEDSFEDIADLPPMQLELF